MSSSVSGPKTLAAGALRSAGLIDKDAPMRDGDHPGGKKTRTRLVRSTRNGGHDVSMKDKTLGPRTPHRLAGSSHAHAGPSDPLAGRGSRIPGRIRRNAVSAGAPSNSAIPFRTNTRPVEGWREFVQKRYDPQARYLNLDSMIDDEVVKKHNLSPPGHGGTAKDSAVIFKLASQLKPEVQTLSLANNNLNAVFLVPLCRYLPNIVNLSLQNNKIREIKEIGMIAPRKDRFVHLRELILLGNPIREIAFAKGNGPVYRSEIVRRFSSLAVLDQEPITQISFDAPEPSTSTIPVEKPSATTFPLEMRPSFVTGVNGDLVANFLSRFFNFFDNQREALATVYDPAATFSFSANTSIPARARVSGLHSSHHYPNQKKLAWSGWLGAGSRNLSRMGTDPVKMVANLHIGPQEIISNMTNLPMTRHDLASGAEKFVVDSFPIPHGGSMGLLLTAHGQFTEVGPGGIRSFDRTFMLLPAPEGSVAKANQWDVVILSDQLIVRGFSSHDAWKTGPLLMQAPSAGKSTPAPAPAPAPTPAAFSITMASLPPDQQAVLTTVPEHQRNLVLAICTRTGLNVKYSIDCLAGNEWDLDRAVSNFDQVKNSLPKDAFL